MRTMALSTRTGLKTYEGNIQTAFILRSRWKNNGSWPHSLCFVHCCIGSRQPVRPPVPCVDESVQIDHVWVSAALLEQIGFGLDSRLPCWWHRIGQERRGANCRQSASDENVNAICRPANSDRLNKTNAPYAGLVPTQIPGSAGV